jgi:hypothetical protein
MRKRRRDSSAIDFRYASSADILVSSTDVHYTSETGGRSANWVRFVIRAWRSTTSRRSCSAVLIYSIPRAAKAFFGLLNASAEFSRQRDVCFGSKADMTAAVHAIPPNADIRQPMRLPRRLHPSQMLESYPRGGLFLANRPKQAAWRLVSLRGRARPDTTTGGAGAMMTLQT